MTDYATRVLDSEDQPVVNVRDYASDLLGSAEKSGGKVSDKDLTYDYDRTLGFGQQAVGSFASDEKEWLRYAAKQLYPNEPIDKAVKRFGKTAEGRYFHTADDGRKFEVQPPSGIARLANIGGGVGHALPVGAGTATGIATAPMAMGGPVGLAGSITLTGGAAAGGEAARQAIGDYLLGDASTNEINPWSVASEGAKSGLGQGIGAGMGAWLQRHAVPDIGKFSAPAMNDVLDKAKNVGVRLTPAEATGLESLVGEQKRLSGIPQSANILKDFIRERNSETYSAYQNFLNKISPRTADAHTLGKEAKAAAEDMMLDVQKQRSAATSPLYEKAFSEPAKVDTTPIIKFIESELPTAKGPMRQALIKAQELLRKPGTDEYDLSLKGLDNAKKSLDDMLETLSGVKGLGANTRYLLNQIRSGLIEAMDHAAHSSGAYAKGRSLHGQWTENAVDPTNAALSPLLRLMGDGAVAPTLKRAAQGMFDPTMRTPGLIMTARVHFTSGKHARPDLWNDLLRQFLHEEAAGALRTMAHGEMRNVAGGLSKALGNEPTLANLKAAMEPGQFRAFSDLMDVFRAAARSVDTNSDTAFKLAAIEKAKKQAGGWMATFFRNVNPVEAVRNAAAFLADRNYEKQAEALAKIYTSGDKEAINALRSFRSGGREDWRRLSVLGEALARVGIYAGEQALD